MSPIGKGLLASALTLPLVAFVAGVLASPDPVDPDRSRPVIIGRVNEDPPAVKPAQAPPTPDDGRKGAGSGGADDTDDTDDDGPVDDDTLDPPDTAVTPQPRHVDGDDGDGDDDDDTDDREGSGDD